MEDKKLSEFSAFLTRNGAEILEKTNSWELIRYKLTECGVLAAYKNAKGRVTMPPEMEKHFERFEAGKHIERHSRLGADANRRTRNKLLERDGDCCFYCGQFLNGERSLEHLVNISDGGNNHLGNLVLTHERCNHAVGDLPLVEKIKVRDRVREATKETPPWTAIDISCYVIDAVEKRKKENSKSEEVV